MNRRAQFAILARIGPLPAVLLVLQPVGAREKDPNHVILLTFSVLKSSAVLSGQVSLVGVAKEERRSAIQKAIPILGKIKQVPVHGV